MKIPGATILRPASAPPEPARDAPSRALPFVVEDGAEPLLERPVSEVGETAVIYLRDRYPDVLAQAAARHYAQRALAVYESVQHLRRRDDLRPLQGVDEYA